MTICAATGGRALLFPETAWILDEVVGCEGRRDDEKILANDKAGRARAFFIEGSSTLDLLGFGLVVVAVVVAAAAAVAVASGGGGGASGCVDVDRSRFATGPASSAEESGRDMASTIGLLAFVAWTRRFR